MTEHTAHFPSAPFFPTAEHRPTHCTPNTASAPFPLFPDPGVQSLYRSSAASTVAQPGHRETAAVTTATPPNTDFHAESFRRHSTGCTFAETGHITTAGGHVTAAPHTDSIIECFRRPSNLRTCPRAHNAPLETGSPAHLRSQLPHSNQRTSAQRHSSQTQTSLSTFAELGHVETILHLQTQIPT